MDDAYNAIDYLSAALEQNKKERMIDDLLGDDIQYKTVLVGKNATNVWIDEDWQGAHDRSKY